jgi:hypothetical protein
MTKLPMTDHELDKALKAVPQTVLPEGFAARLQARLEAPSSQKVIAFPARKTRVVSGHRLWLSVIPLAASLAAGLYLGAIGDVTAAFTSLDSSLVSDASDQNFGSGFEDTEDFVNGDLT